MKRQASKKQNTSGEPHQREISPAAWRERWNIDASRSLWHSLGRSRRKWAILAPVVPTAYLTVCLCIFCASAERCQPVCESRLSARADVLTCAWRASFCKRWVGKGVLLIKKVKVVCGGMDIRVCNSFWHTHTHKPTHSTLYQLSLHHPPPSTGTQPVCLSVCLWYVMYVAGRQQLSWAGWKTISNLNCYSQHSEKITVFVYDEGEKHKTCFCAWSKETFYTSHK